MNFKIKKPILLFCFLLFLSSSTPAFGDPGTNWGSSHAQDQMTSTMYSQKIISSSYTPHDPIRVYPPYTDFTDQGFTGNGTIEDPYIFENYIITNDTTTLIEILNTDAHFIIRNNYLDGMSGIPIQDGIILHNVTNGIIEKNTVINLMNCGIGVWSQCSNIIVTDNTLINNGYRGISSVKAYNSSFTNNQIYNQIGDGMSFSNSTENLISNNTIHDNGDYGIEMEDSMNNLVTNNSIVNNSDGIIISGNSEQITVSNNSIIGNRGAGVYRGAGITLMSSFCNITGNSILNNRRGITLGGSSNNVSKNIVGQNNRSIYVGSSNHSITENIFYSRGGIGMHITSGTSNVIVKWNDFIGHELTDLYDSQVNAMGDYYFSENYWDDWTCPDADADGIVDNPYPIPPGELTDESPLTSPHNEIPMDLHLLSRPRLLFPKFAYPSEHLEIKGTIMVKWCSVTDFSDHSVSYSLYYSTEWNELETVWEELATDLTTPEYEWDTTSVDDGWQYVLKVVAVCSEGVTSEYLLINDNFKINNRTTAADTDGWSFSMIILTLWFLIIAARKKKSK